MVYVTAKNLLGMSKKIEEVEEVIDETIKDDELKGELGYVLRQLKLVSPGASSPSFEFEDINGNKVSSESLKGKLVYIDIWATWCGPCLAELPALKQLEDTLKNDSIHFVSICYRDSKENWKKMVNSKQLGGVQLFANPTDESFFESYQIKGVPYFILLDAKGNIIERDAKRPSNPELLPQILDNL